MIGATMCRLSNSRLVPAWQVQVLAAKPAMLGQLCKYNKFGNCSVMLPYETRSLCTTCRTGLRGSGMGCCWPLSQSNKHSPAPWFSIPWFWRVHSISTKTQDASCKP